jgi:O-antigen/teichoic acid export membrane protein
VSAIPEPQPVPRLRDKIVYGGAWVFALRIAGRTITILLTVVLARLLAPSDFGVVAIAMLAIAFLDTLSQTGSSVALVQKREDIHDFLDTVWSIALVRGVALYGGFYLSAPWIADFFGNPGAVPILRVLALTFVLHGACNVGMVYLSRDLDFRKLCFYEFSATLANAVVALTLAIVLRNAWALVWATIARHVVLLLLSYALHPFRPHLRPDLSKARELYHFGRWVAGSSVLLFFINRGDNAFVGKMLGDAALGLYTVAFSIANLPTTEVTRVIAQVMFPAYAKLQDDPRRLRESYRRSLEAIAFLSAPMAGGIALCAGDFVPLVLDTRWHPMVPVIQVLAIGGFLRAVTATAGPLLQAVGRPEVLTALVAGRLLTMAVLIYPLGQRAGLPGIAAAVALSAAVIEPVTLALAARLSGNRLGVVARAVLLPVINTAAAGIFVGGTAAMLADAHPAARLAICAVAGALCYIGLSAFAERRLRFEAPALMRDALGRLRSRAVLRSAE